TCAGQGGSGFSNCATLTSSQNVWDSEGSLGTVYVSPIAFNDGSGSIAWIKIRSVPIEGQSHVYASVFHSDGTNCGDVELPVIGAANGDSWINDGLFTAAPSGNSVSVFFFDPAPMIRHFNVDANCGYLPEDTSFATSSSVKYLSAATGQDGTEVHLFYTDSTPNKIWYARIVPR